MADIICRWRNGTPQTVVELVNSMPHKVMPSSDFRIYMTQNWNGDFFRTPYQLACQLGLYCEAEDGMFYPRFDHDISVQSLFGTHHQIQHHHYADRSREHLKEQLRHKELDYHRGENKDINRKQS